jgi:hypothetical protein
MSTGARRRLFVKKISSLVLLSAVCLLAVHPLWSQTLPNADKINKSVIFIYSATSDGSAVDESRPLGTGFFVQVPVKSLPGKSYFLLVTARHVVQPAWAFCPLVNPSVVYIRLNKKDFVEGQGTGVEYVRVDLTTSLVTGPENVDVAILTKPEYPRDMVELTKKYDVDGVPVNYFAPKDGLEKLSFGDEVASAGLLPSFPGSLRNYPIFKFGHISAKPTEAIPAPCVQNPSNIRSLKLFFIAMNLVPGNSGSPIFFTPTPFSGQKPNFIGLQSLSYLAADVAGVTSVDDIFTLIEGLSSQMPNADLTRQESPVKQTN